MKLLAEIRIASATAQNTVYIPVVVEAADGREAQLKAIDIAQAAHPNAEVSGGPVHPATAEAIADAEERLDCKALTEAKPKAKKGKAK